MSGKELQSESSGARLTILGTWRGINVQWSPRAARRELHARTLTTERIHSAPQRGRDEQLDSSHGAEPLR
jgi:hypothetical protein